MQVYTVPYELNSIDRPKLGLAIPGVLVYTIPVRTSGRRTGDGKATKQGDAFSASGLGAGGASQGHPAGNQFVRRGARVLGEVGPRGPEEQRRQQGKVSPSKRTGRAGVRSTDPALTDPLSEPAARLTTIFSQSVSFGNKAHLGGNVRWAFSLPSPP